jgi:uncharacterized protein
VTVRVAVRVQPGSPRALVGGSRGGALLVRVTARPVQGKATEAALRAVAAAFGVRRADIGLVSGGTSRDKVVAIEGDPDWITGRLRALLTGPAR